MSNNLLAYPIINELEYRSNINSKELNLMLKSIEESILRAIMRSAELENQLTSLNLASNAAYLALSRSNQIYNYYPKDASIPIGEYGGVCFATAFGDISGVRQDKLAGILTLDWNQNKKLSKIPIYNGVISPSVQIYVDGALRIIDDPVYKIIDTNKSTFWIESASAGEHTLELVLPPSSKKTFNYIEVIPFPIFGMEITKIEYYDFQSVLQTIYPSQDNPFYNNSGPLILHLAPREFNNSIKLTFNVLSGIDVMGFSSIDIASIDYLNNTNTSYLKFEGVPPLDHNGNILSEIMPISIDLDFYSDGVIDNNYNSFISEISLVTSPVDNPTSYLVVNKKRGYQVINTSNSAFNVVQDGSEPNTLYLKVVMNEVNFTTPVIRGAKLNYREII